MATIDEFVERNALTRVDVPLDRGQRPWRQFLAVGRLVSWIKTELPVLDGDWGDLKPLQQLDASLADFVSGEPLQLNNHIKQIRPLKHGIWELRTVDLRVFGWFAARNAFVGCSGGLKNQIKRYGLIDEYRNLAVSDRDKMDHCGGQMCVYGEKYNDVLSDAPVR